MFKVSKSLLDIEETEFLHASDTVAKCLELLACYGKPITIEMRQTVSFDFFLPTNTKNQSLTNNTESESRAILVSPRIYCFFPLKGNR